MNEIKKKTNSQEFGEYISLCNEAGDYVFVTDTEGYIEYVSSNTAQKTGWTQTALISQNIEKIILTASKMDMRELIDLLKIGQYKRIRTSLINAGGREIFTECMMFRRIELGTGKIWFVLRDLTDAVIANEKFLKIFSNSPIPMAISNIDTSHYTDVNESFVKTIGYEKHEVIGKKISVLKLFVEQRTRNQIVKDVVEYGSVRNREVQIRDKQGYIHTGYFSADVLEIKGERVLLTSFNDMTYIRKSEQETLTTKAQLAAILDNMPSYAWLKDIDGHYIEVNKPFEEAVNKKSADIMGKSDFELWPSEVAKAYQRKERQALDTEKQVFSEVLFNDGAMEQWYEIYVSPVFNKNGSVIGTAGISKTITERKLLEIELKNQKKMLKSMIDVIPDLIFYKDTNGVYLGCNSAFSDKFIGLSEQEIVGKTDLDFVKDIELANFFREKDRIVLAATETISNEETITMADGSVVDIETAKTPFFDEGGNVAGLIGVSRDITTRIAVKKELEYKEELLSCVAMAIKELLYERNYYEAIERCFSILGKTVGVEQICLFQNRVVEKKGVEMHVTSLNIEWQMSGKRLDKKRMENIPFAEVWGVLEPLAKGELIYGNVKGIDWGAFCECIEEHKTQTIVALPVFVKTEFWGFVVFEDQKLDRKWTESEFSILKAFTGSLERAIERSMIEEELERSKVIAEMANRAKSAFLANMNHELRTPLNAILGFSELLSKEEGFSESAKENLRIIRRSGEHLLSLINDVLNLSKIEAGKVTLNNQTFDMHHLLRYMVEIFQPKAEMKNLKFELIQSEKVPQYVHGDEIKLKQILMNLLSNAVKFTSKGFITLTVDSEELDRGMYDLKFEVVDTGSGIETEELKDLFTPFVQTTTGKESKDGTGLGLAIAKSFITLMKGDIQVKSHSGNGTKFTFDIRLKISNKALMTVDVSEKRVVSLKPGQPQYRMLIADDISDNRQLIYNMLSPYGFELKKARNGKETVELWKKWHPHLIWMDVRMPVMDGYEATRIIKEAERDNLVPSRQQTVIIGVSASTFDEEREIVLTSGFDDFVSKPFTESLLFEQMKKHLGLEYEEQDKPKDKVKLSAQSKYGVTEIIQDMRCLPDETLKKLERVTESLNMEAMENCIQEIESFNPKLAEEIKEVAEAFKYDDILRFVVAARKA